MKECIFCKIGAGEVGANEVYRDDAVVAIEDLSPQAPVHLLVIPVEHHASIVEASQREKLLGELISVASCLGREHGGSDGFRLVVNTGPKGGQTVDHVHVHVLAGRQMAWPPG